MRRIAVVLVLLVAATVWPATGAHAQGSTTIQAVDGLQADFNNDGLADLAIGVAGENLGAASNAGAVNVLYGTAGGLTGAGGQLFTQDSPGVPGGSEAGDGFGDALAVGDFDGDGFFEFAGAVNVLPGSAGGLTGTGSQLFTQNSPGVPGVVEFDDFFGEALAAAGP